MAAACNAQTFPRRHGQDAWLASLCTLFGGAVTPRAARAASDSPTISPGHYVPDFAPRAKRAIYLFMSGAPPQMDLWDYKPGLAALYDKDLPDSVRGTQALTGMTAGQARFPIAPSHWGFTRQGKSGRWVSDLLPWTVGWWTNWHWCSRCRRMLSIMNRPSY